MRRIYTWKTRDGRLCWSTKPRVFHPPLWRKGPLDAEPGGTFVVMHRDPPTEGERLLFIDVLVPTFCGGGK